MYKISQIAEKFNLSRSTLLYYESIGLIKAAKRTAANYRLYSNEDIKRLELVCMYKDMGIVLKDIMKLLDDKTEKTEILELALIKMEENINEIRSRQRKIMEIMKNDIYNPSDKAIIFSSVLRSLGLSKKDLKLFHIEYEKSDKEGHRAFLKFLGLSESDISHMLMKLE